LNGIAYYQNGIQVVNKSIDFVDQDSLPFAARDYLSLCAGKTNYATLVGSRGCYGSCTFCSNYSFEGLHAGPKWRPRNPMSIVEEMQELFETRGISVFKFNDPNIFGPGKEGRDHVVALCREIRKRNLSFHLMGFCRGNDIFTDPSIVPELKQGGFERLLIGVESSNDVILQKFCKGETIVGMEKALNILNREGISTIIGFMIFNPYTTIESLKKDIDFLQKKGQKPTLSKALRVFDGTPIQTILEEEGRLIKRNPFEGYHDYIMPKEISAIYASMKILFSRCLDRLRAVGQGNIWQIKKAPSFRDRQEYSDLSEAFFGVELFLLKELIHWTEIGNFSFDNVRSVVNEIYDLLEHVGEVISVNARECMSSPELVSREIYTLMKEKPWNTFHEEYRWNED
jgi:radical SAM superfamily enzyme YgiQ (UPF0313 family)